MTPATPRLALSGITRRFPGVLANDAIDLDVARGEIHAVLGENGAGKSTLVRIIYGLTRPDAGTIRWEGELVDIDSPAAARRLGIAMVFQHFSLFESLRVVDNIALAEDGVAADAALAARVRDVSRNYGLPLDPLRHVHTMSVGERQRVEIVRCLLQGPRLLIMDEPTSVLTPQAIGMLFDTLRTLAREGMSILYISHKLPEIRALCDRATILRDGRVTGECDPRSEPTQSLARMMIGGDLPVPRARAARPGGVCLAVAHLALAADDPFGTALVDVDLDVHHGEIFGIAGVSGNGQRELVAALAGERQTSRDAVRIDGVGVGDAGVAARRLAGVAHVPEDRRGRASVPEFSLAQNAVLSARGGGIVRNGLIDDDAAAAFARAVIASFDVRTDGPGALAETLSGGNLQKFIVGREIRKAPKLLIVEQPTWGVDVAAATQIREALLALRDAGAAVLVISEDLDELFEICDRIAVIAAGRVSAALDARATNAEEIGLMMTGEPAAAVAA